MEKKIKAFMTDEEWDAERHEGRITEFISGRTGYKGALEILFPKE